MRTAPLLLLLSLSLTVSAVPPRLEHGTLATVPAAGDLGRQIRSAGTPWVGYSVPAVNTYTVMCCYNWNGGYRSGGGCRLSDDSSSFTNIDKDDLHVSHAEVAVFYRVTNGVIDRVRQYSTDCPLDASSSAVTWIDNVDPKASVALLSSLSGDGRELTKRALSALAMHAEPAAGDKLDALARSAAAGDQLRGEAIFWLAETRGERALDAARAIMREADSSRHLREKAIFALSQIRTSAATDELIRIARDDRDRETRGKALFWLSQKAGEKALAALKDAVDNDPDDDIKAKAVFGISQLPDDRSVPLLIELARTHPSRAVRKKAIFWLGQKNDPRALEAIERIIRE